MHLDQSASFYTTIRARSAGETWLLRDTIQRDVDAVVHATGDEFDAAMFALGHLGGRIHTFERIA